MEPVISYQNVTKIYGAQTALHDVSLDIAVGTFVTVVGASGGGKTTLLKMVNRLIEPTSGEIFIRGQNIKELDLIELRRSIGYAIQGSVLFPHMTVEENISYVPRLWNKGDHARTRRAVQKWMELMHLPETLLSRYPDELSGGQQQRVGIARALAASPEILLMDEPFGAVDEVTRSALQEELRRIYRETGITILFVTHDIREAMRLGTHVIVVAEGCVHQYGTPEAVRENPATAFVAQLIQVLRG